MPLTEQIQTDLQVAMKAGEASRVSTLRMLLSALKNREIASGGPLDDTAVEGVIGREIKQRRESAESYRSGERPELAEKEDAEAEILQTYLPEQLPETELVAIVDRAVAAAGAGAQMGAVIGRVRSEVGSRADGATIARLVQAKLGK